MNGGTTATPLSPHKTKRGTAASRSSHVRWNAPPQIREGWCGLLRVDRAHLTSYMNGSTWSFFFFNTTILLNPAGARLSIMINGREVLLSTDPGQRGNKQAPAGLTTTRNFHRIPEVPQRLSLSMSKKRRTEPLGIHKQDDAKAKVAKLRQWPRLFKDEQ
ncbi:hypothetical protein CFIO01_05152 [Colletotrichum fioriniae PJ7]|uniref:Uncharacterized protein n=1 Tax=Colletotrichum fioriniae PJ7 TaxID=1445577 RepID=A0A010RRX7_9PEZI|nr:hypothetical protein CFIO01_05152 [Colletotrichum fioriniae PJ7]